LIKKMRGQMSLQDVAKITNVEGYLRPLLAQMAANSTNSDNK